MIWRNLASVTIVFAYACLTVWILVSTIVTPLLSLITDTQTYWIFRNVWIPRHLSTTISITTCVGAILGACALAYMSSELAPDILLFIWAVWATVLSALIHHEDINTVGRFLRNDPWSASWVLLAKCRSSLLLLGVLVGSAGTGYLILLGPAALELDTWFLVLAAWFGLWRYVVTDGDWKAVKRVLGRRWRALAVTAISAATVGAWVSLEMGNYNRMVS
jgi:hypothetical protein